jgi:hypothetical protein
MISDYVIQAGYTTFYEVLTSDHRGVFVDIDAEKFYGAENPDSTRPAARLLKSTDRKAVARYTKHLKAHLGDCEKVLKDIDATAQSPEETKARYDTVDDKIESSELQCARPRKESLWSKKLKAAELLVRCWKARKSQLKSKQSLAAAIKRLHSEIDKLLPDEEDDDNEDKDDDEEPDDQREKTSGRVDDDGRMSGKYVNAQMRKAKAPSRTHVRTTQRITRSSWKKKPKTRPSKAISSEQQDSDDWQMLNA